MIKDIDELLVELDDLDYTGPQEHQAISLNEIERDLVIDALTLYKEMNTPNG